MRAVVGRPTTLVVVLADDQGDASQADAHTSVTVDVVDGAGHAVVTGADATDDRPVGQYSYVLTPQVNLDTFTVTWHATMGGFATVTTDILRLAANRILSPRDLAADETLSALDPPTRAEVLDGVEDLFADALGFPPVLEGARINWDAHRGMFSEAYAYGDVQTAIFTGIPGLGFGFGGERMIVPGCAMPQEVFALTINGNPVADSVIAQFRAGPGFLIWSGGRSWPTGNYDMHLSHGLPFVPGDLRWAAATFARYVARRTMQSGKPPSLLPERTASVTTEAATIVFAISDPDRPTGLPDVDSVLQRYRLSSVI